MPFSYDTGQARAEVSLKINIAKEFPPPHKERVRSMPLRVTPTFVRTPHEGPYDFAAHVTVPFHDLECGTWRFNEKHIIHFSVPVDEIASRFGREGDSVDNLYIRFRCYKILDYISIHIRCWFNNPHECVMVPGERDARVSYTSNDWNFTKLCPFPPDDK